MPQWRCPSAGPAGSRTRPALGRALQPSASSGLRPSGSPEGKNTEAITIALILTMEHFGGGELLRREIRAPQGCDTIKTFLQRQTQENKQGAEVWSKSPTAPLPHRGKATIQLMQNDEEPDICAICRAPLTEDGPVIHLTCNHRYHRQCILTWSQNQGRTNNICPLRDGGNIPLVVVQQEARRNAPGIWHYIFFMIALFLISYLAYNNWGSIQNAYASLTGGNDGRLRPNWLLIIILIILPMLFFG
ncbi:RING finger protein [Azospirillum sp. ST 5-10]|uniref:RING finger protein n=1 Tax=unclassified Azospirillum TaxID=2630922 RepID=UPI003F4A5B25